MISILKALAFYILCVDGLYVTKFHENTYHDF